VVEGGGGWWRVEGGGRVESGGGWRVAEGGGWSGGGWRVVEVEGGGWWRVVEGEGRREDRGQRREVAEGEGRLEVGGWRGREYTSWTLSPFHQIAPIKPSPSLKPSKDQAITFLLERSLLVRLLSG
jgi:hypothetical protein